MIFFPLIMSPLCSNLEFSNWCHVMLHICHVEVPCHHHITMPCHATHLSCRGTMSSSYHHAMSSYTFVVLGCHVIIISPCHVMLHICHVGVPCHHHITMPCHHHITMPCHATHLSCWGAMSSSYHHGCHKGKANVNFLQ